MARSKRKVIDWKPGESYSAARNRWWSSLTIEEKKQFVLEANELGRKLQARVTAARRRKSAA